MRNVSHWIPAALCAFISLMTMSVRLVTGSDAAMPVFYCFLPMCFFFMGSATCRMHAEIRELRRELDELRRKRSG